MAFRLPSSERFPHLKVHFRHKSCETGGKGQDFCFPETSLPGQPVRPRCGTAGAASPRAASAERASRFVAPRGGPPTKHLRPRRPRPHSLTTAQSRRRAASAPRARPGVAGLSLHAGGRAPKAEAALPAAPSLAGLAGRAAQGGRSKAPFRPPRPRPLPGRGLSASHSARPGPHSFFSQPLPRRQAAAPIERPRSGSAPTTRPAELCGRPPKLGWGWIPPTYIFPPPQPPPALLSR